MKFEKFLKTVGVVFSITLFTAALFIIHNELKDYKVHILISELRNLSLPVVTLALVLTILNYAIMTGYDYLAFRYIGHAISYAKIVIASSISYAFSNNMGFIMFSGAPVRYRLYTSWGFSAGDIARVVVFCTLSLWLGFLTLGGVLFLVEPFAIPSGISFRLIPLHAVGILFLGIVAWYVFSSIFKKKPFTLGGWILPVIPLRLSMFQITVSTMDWALSAAVLYVLLPAGTALSFPSFIGIFMLAEVTGLISNVPGGLGVFESVMIIFLSPHVNKPELLGALIAYRGIYYLLPLLISSLTLGVIEIIRVRTAVKKILAVTGSVITVASPHVLALATFVGGAILLISGSTPAVPERIALLRDFLPLQVIEISHFLGSITGMILILLARSLQKRIHLAYILALVLLAGGALFSILKGFDYEEAVILALLFLALLPSRQHFNRNAFIIDQRFTPGWISLISLLLILTVWIGLFSYRHVEYANYLWWQFAFYGDAPRFLRAGVGIAIVALSFLITKLLRPHKPRPSLPDALDIERTRSIAASSKHTYAYLSLLGDKSFLFSPSGKSFIMYGIDGRSWVAMGDPVGKNDEREELIWKFYEQCDRYDGRVVFYEAGEENMRYYADLGLSFIKLGEEGMVDLETFTLEGSGRKEMRYTLNKLDREGCSFHMIQAGEIGSYMTELSRISDSWLSSKNTREKGFSLGFFDEAYLKHFPAAIVKRGADIIAFANVWQGAEKEELSLDLMRYSAGAPHGVMDYLFLKLMIFGKEDGYRWFNLGMAPFAGLEARPASSLWIKLGSFVFHHGEHFYNFQGIRRYKDKFDPVWNPKYLAYPGVFTLPRVTADIASLVSRGLKGVIGR